MALVPSATEARREWGEMLEANGLLSKALEVYEGATATTDSLLERRVNLLCRMRRFDDAAALLPPRANGAAAALFPRTFALAYRFGLTACHDDGGVAASAASPVDFASGAFDVALERAVARHAAPAMVLVAAEQLERVMALLRAAPGVAPSTLRRYAAILSWAPLRANAANSALALENGTLARIAAQAGEHVAAGDASDACKELRWKITVARARMGPRAELMGVAAQQCEAGQRWRVWLEGAKLEAPSSVAKARALVAKALQECPERHRATVLLAAAALETDAAVASALLDKAWRETGDWKVALEQAMAALRTNNGGGDQCAVDILKRCLSASPGAGRIWALLCRLTVPRSEALEEAALRLVPKSGELWCEIGRHCARAGQWQRSRDCFDFAAEFTPQYGDTFIEAMRAQLARVLCSRFGFGATCAQLQCANCDTGDAVGAPPLKQWDTSDVERICVAAAPNHGMLWDALARNGAAVFEILAEAKLAMVAALATAPADQLLMDALFDSWRTHEK